MTFEPINPKNAVLEAVVVLQMNRQFSADESKAIFDLHKNFLDDLPSLQPLQVMNFMVGVGTMPSHFPPIPQQMAAFKKDGSLDARFAVSGNLLIVNFLTYTRWHILWQKARNWIKSAIETISALPAQTDQSPLGVSSISHQMTDVFRGIDGERFNIDNLLDQQFVRLPKAAFNEDRSSWNVSDSYVEKSEIAGLKDSQLADSFTCDFSNEMRVGWRVRIDHVLELRIKDWVPPINLFDTVTLPLDTIISNLHERNKSMMCKALSSEMQNKIGLIEL